MQLFCATCSLNVMLVIIVSMISFTPPLFVGPPPPGNNNGPPNEGELMWELWCGHSLWSFSLRGKQLIVSFECQSSACVVVHQHDKWHLGCASNTIIHTPILSYNKWTLLSLASSYQHFFILANWFCLYVRDSVCCDAGERRATNRCHSLGIISRLSWCLDYVWQFPCLSPGGSMVLLPPLTAFLPYNV